MPTLADILKSLPEARLIRGDSSCEVHGATHDSRRVSPGDLFAVLRGRNTDGSRFISQALERGASALLVEEAQDEDIPQILVEDSRAALGPASAAAFSDPTRELAVVGITGTNGKTTVTYMVEAALAAGGARPGVMGTVEYRFEGHTWDAAHTTPEAPVIQSMARRMVDLGATHLVMETSSHGIALRRTDGVVFKVVAFTNLTQDHLDFHGDMDDYGRTKMRLFTDAIRNEPDACAVVNVDDPFGRVIAKQVGHPLLTVSTHPGSDADVRPSRPPIFGIDGIDAEIATPGGLVRLRSPLLGEHNLSNLVVALGICMQLGLDGQKAADGLGRLANVPGRLERVPSDEPFTVTVDYAHTPDALERVLEALRPLTEGRLICVFGCGGDRDPVKRPLMAEAVKNGADIAIVTSDNPRTEDPADIIRMILPGLEDEQMKQVGRERLKSCARGYIVDPDRRGAIFAAVAAARDKDTVLIAGKGHEDYQVLGTEKIHFDDRETAAAALAQLKRGTHA